MTMQTMTYRNSPGLRTRTGAYVLTYLFMASTTFEAARLFAEQYRAPEWPWVALAVATIIPAAVSFHLLGRLGDLEQQHHTVTPTMRRMHRIAISLPPMGLGAMVLLAQLLG